MAYEQLTSSDQDDALAFLLRSPEMCVVLIHNIRAFGMGPGDSPFNADYFGTRGPGGMTSVGALYNLGSFFFRADSATSVRGMADYIAGLGRMPIYTAGARGQVEVFLDELGGRAPAKTNRIDSVYMVLQELSDDADPSGARLAMLDDLDRIAALQLDFEREAFGANVMDIKAVRKLLEYQITMGAAAVVEKSGRIVSKAEATVTRPEAALLGGVYTIPECRGRGLSTACMSLLCDSLLDVVGKVGLNVFVSNMPARTVYKKVGFVDTEDWLTVEMSH